MVIMQSWADNEGKCHLCRTTQTGKIKLSSKCLEAEFLNFCWKCQVPDQLTGHCFFPCLKKASLEVKWKGKVIACHLLARSWELFSNEHRSTASTPQCSVVSGRERFNIYVSIGERLHEVFLLLFNIKYWYFQYVAIMILTQLNNKAMISNNLSEQGIVCYLLNPSSKSSPAQSCMQQIM